MKKPFRIWFVGAHAVGKSTLAELTARNYNLPYISEQARIVLAERLQPDFDRLRLDVAETSRYQREVMRRQIATEAQQLHTGYVSDRAFDNLAYAAKHAEGVAAIARLPETRRYIRDLCQTVRQRRGVVFFVRPLPSYSADGMRAVGDLHLAGVHAIDGMVQLLLELGDGRGPVPYVPVETACPKMRQRLVEEVLAPYLGRRGAAAKTTAKPKRKPAPAQRPDFIKIFDTHLPLVPGSLTCSASSVKLSLRLNEDEIAAYESVRKQSNSWHKGKGPVPIYHPGLDAQGINTVVFTKWGISCQVAPGVFAADVEGYPVPSGTDEVIVLPRKRGKAAKR